MQMKILLTLLLIAPALAAQTVVTDQLVVTIHDVHCAEVPRKIFAVVGGDDRKTYDLNRQGDECRWTGSARPKNVVIGQTLISLRTRGARTLCRRAIEVPDASNPNQSVAFLEFNDPDRTAGDLRILDRPDGADVDYVRVVRRASDDPPEMVACREQGALKKNESIDDVMLDTETLEFSLSKLSLQRAIQFALDARLQADIKADKKTKIKKIPRDRIGRAIAIHRGYSSEENYRLSTSAIQNDLHEIGDLSMTLGPPK